MNILLCCQNYPGLGGIENSIKNMYSIFKSNGHNVKVYTFNIGDTKSDDVLEIKKGNDYKFKRLLLTGSYASYLSIKKYISDNKDFKSADVIVTRSPQFACAAIEIYPQKKVIYIPPAIMKEFYNGVLSDLSWKLNFKNKLKYSLLSKSEVWLENKLATKKELLWMTFSSKLLSRLNDKYERLNAIVQVPGVNSCFKMDYESEKIKVNYLPTFIYVGRLEAGKNIESIVNIFNELNGIANIKIIGDGAMSEYLKTIANDNIRFLGRVSGQSLAKEYSSSDMFLLLTENEGFGQVFVESLCTGTPVMGFSSSFANTAVSEIIESEDFGIEIFSNDIEAINKAIELAVLRVTSGYYNRNYIKKQSCDKYSWRKMCEKIIEI